MSSLVILTDSLRALTLLRDCMAASVKNYLVFKIAHLVAGLLDLGRAVRFVWVPGHVGIIENEVADGVARAAGGLPYCIQYSLPYCDLLDPIGRDFEAWARLLWPYVRTGCSCGAPLRDLSHVLHDCPQLEEFRPGYYAFLSGRFPDRKPEGIPIEDLVFDPGPGVVGALAGHLGRCDRVL